MTYACQIDLLRILRATLSLVKAADFPEKDSPLTDKVSTCISSAISELENSLSSANGDLTGNTPKLETVDLNRTE